MKKKNFINDYDKIYYKKNYQKDVNLVFKKSKNLKNKKILDIGCGTGKYTILLKKKFLLSKKKILGIDIDEDSIKLAKKNGGYFKYIEISKLKSNNFTIVTALFNVINYIKSEEKLKKFFRDTKKIMTENSIIFFDCMRVVKKGNFKKRKFLKNFKLNVETNGYAEEKNQNLKITYKITRLGKIKFTYKKTIMNYYWDSKKIMSILKELNFKNIEILVENSRLLFFARI